MLAFINWDVNPVFFTLGPLSIRYYGLLFALAFYAAYVVFVKIFKRENISMAVLDSLTLYMIIGVVIGARLGHVLFYEPDYYFSHPMEIIKVWHGGLASHGAALGILIALYLFSRKYKRPYLWTLDRIAIVVPLSGAFIRIGNLMNSEIYGHQTNLPWGFIFLRNGETVPKHPTQIYEALAYLSIFIVLWWMYRKGKKVNNHGYYIGLMMVLLFMARFLIEFVKNPQVGFENSMAINMGQILSIPFILAGIAIMIWSTRKTVTVSK
ncbi:MAG TPA: prolipoprotein diacylglyceryl transferase [Williamwhitmania sp.]|nr:prolipoprotein diacylglyceryl transferase [Williamwhitmania sp.]